MNEKKGESVSDVLSTELSSNLQINNNNIQTTEDTAVLNTGQLTDKYENDQSKAHAIETVEQYECKQDNVYYTEDDSTNYYKGATKSLTDAELNLDEDLLQFKSAGKTQKPKELNMSRKKIKEYNIISKRNAVARPPCYFKLDRATTTLLDLLIQHRLLKEYHNAIRKGTKSVVIHAQCYGKYHTYFPCGNAVKVYSISNDEEKNKAVYKVVQREVDVLYTLSTKHFGNNFPHPVYHTKNIMVMSFIGTDQETAPSIETVPPEQSEEVYHLVVKEMGSWYNKLHLIHGNLSARTVLNWEGKLYFIGWSHCLLADHPQSMIKLMKDCLFVTKFFENRGVPVKTTEELFKDITGQDYISSKLQEVVQVKDLWKDPKQTNPNRKGNVASKPNRIDRFK